MVMLVMVVVVMPSPLGAERQRNSVGLAGPGAFPLAQVTALGEPFHVVVVAVLGGSHLSLEAEHLGAVLAEGAVHGGVAPHHLLNPFHKRVEHAGVIAQIGGLEKFDLRVIGRHPIGVLQDPAHQHAGEQKIREYQDAAESQFHGVAQAGLHQGEGDPGVHGLPPAEAEALHQHPGHLGHIGVGIGIGRSPSHHHQQGVVQRHRWPAAGGRLRQGLLQAAGGRLDHLAVDPQFAAVVDPQSALGAVGVQHGGDVVLGVASGEQHRRHRQHMLHSACPQGVEAVAQDRPCKFQVAVLHRDLRQALPQGLGQGGEFTHRQAIAAAVPAHQHTDAPVGSVLQVRARSRQRGTGGHGNTQLWADPIAACSGG